MAPTATREHAHDLIDRMAPSQVSAVVVLLEAMLDPVARAIANAPVDDEPEAENERTAVAASKAEFALNPSEGLRLEDLIAEFKENDRSAHGQAQSA